MTDHSSTPQPITTQSDTLDYLAVLRDMARQLSQAARPTDALHAAYQTLQRLLGTAEIGIYHCEGPNQTCTRVMPAPEEHSPVTSPDQPTLYTALWADLNARQTSRVVPNLPGDPQFAASVPSTVGAAAAFPIWRGVELRGMVCITHGQPYDYQPAEITTLETIAAQLGPVLATGSARQDTFAAAAANNTPVFRRLSAVAQSTGEAILVTDEQGVVKLLSPSASTLLGLHPGAIEHQPLHAIPFPAEIRTGLITALDQFATGHTTFDVQLQDKRSLAVMLSTVEHPTLDTPYVGGWVIIIRDLTRLRDAERTRLNFIHSAAHDLRNPLGVTLGALSMLNSEIELNGTEMEREIIQIGLAGLARMEKMINGLLHLEQIESDAGLHKSAIDVHDWIERAIMDTRPFMEQREQQFECDIPHRLPAIQGDMHWLTRALVNVLSNANQFTPAGGTIALRVSVDSETLCLDIEDNGAGIPTETQARIFDPFIHAEYSKNTPESDGVGLGLTIVKAVIERHQGRVFVRSAPGEGTLFSIRLPL